MTLNKIYVDNLIKTALLEDINYCDVTTDYLIPEEQDGNARFVAKADGIVCGTEVAVRVFTLLDDTVTYEILKKDGEEVQKGDVILTLKGKTRTLLKGERTALNLIQHMSGIATASHRYAQIVEGTNASIADTRKTLPGLRPLQKYAVMTGGAKNHRYNLSDAAMLKDNHIDAAGGITAAITALRKKIGHMTKIEVETRNLDELKEALSAGADIIMLDNMSPVV
ncbi:MAG TPA: carboxylating nicotinate-nucleotide diphosphorylase, partial [Ruminococcaceae bacterium]|nr:carboxylating nicotinate-nucleotide diphosphorylase [Oscillospiraceae bacterium]